MMIAGGLLATTCAFAGGNAPTALTAKSPVLRPATHRILSQRPLHYPVVSVATQVVSRPGDTAKVRPIVVRQTALRVSSPSVARVMPIALQP